MRLVSLLFIACFFINGTVWADCPKLDNLTQIVQTGDTAMNASVTVVNDKVKASVVSSLAEFKLSTQQLSLKQSNTEAIEEWYTNMMNMQKVAYQKIKAADLFKNDADAKKYAEFIVDKVVEFWVGNALDTTMHESAHHMAMKANGASSAYYQTGNDPNSPQLTLGGMFLNLLKDPLSHADTTPVGLQLAPGTRGFEQSAQIAAAGLNAQTKFSNDIATNSMRNGTISEAEAFQNIFVLNKADVVKYYVSDPKLARSDSDLKDYISSLRSQGVISANTSDVDAAKKLATYSAASAVLSGRTWEGFQAIVSDTGDAKTMRMKTPFGDVAWPEVSTYLNPKNAAVKVQTNIATADGSDGTRRSFDASVEQSVMGSHVTEVSGSANTKNGRESLSATATANTAGKLGLKFQAAFSPSVDGNWFLYGGAGVDTGTLEGQRKYYNSHHTSGEVYIGWGILLDKPDGSN